MAYQKNKSLGDGIEVLEALAASGRPLGSRELARMLDMEPTRANRILRTLSDIGMAEQDAMRKYHPGPGIHLLSALSLNGSALLKKALPVMESSRSKAYTMALGVLWKKQVSYLVHAGSKQSLAQGIGHMLFPAHTSSIGRILLNPGNTRGYASVKHGTLFSVAVPVGLDNPVAGLAYAQVPRPEIRQATEDLKMMAKKIYEELQA